MSNVGFKEINSLKFSFKYINVNLNSHIICELNNNNLSLKYFEEKNSKKNHETIIKLSVLLNKNKIFIFF